MALAIKVVAGKSTAIDTEFDRDSIPRNWKFSSFWCREKPLNLIYM